MSLENWKVFVLHICGFLSLACGSGGSGAVESKPTGDVSDSHDSVPTVVSTDVEEREKTGLENPKDPVWVVRRNLVAELSRAEIYVEGLAIDIGSADMNKYSRGGWGSGWGRNQRDRETSVAKINSSSAWLDIDSQEPVRELLIRAKGRGRMRISLGKASGSVALTDVFTIHRISFSKAVLAGRHRIKIGGRNSIVDWIWLREIADLAIPSFPHHTSQDSKNELLRAPTPRTFYFTLIPQPGDHLRVWVKGGGSGNAIVSAQQDMTKAKELLGVPLQEDWQMRTLDLSEFTGRATRLNFKNVDGAATWRDLAIVHVSADRGGSQAQIAKRAENVIVLLIDTQRADSFSVVGKDGGIGAKGYESLVPQSATFKNAYNNENWTKPSIASLDTGLYPSAHLARWRKDRCSKDLVFLSEHLQEKGFATAGLVSNMSAGAKFGFNQGWDSFEKTDNAQQTFGQALEWLDNRDTSKRFFLYVQTIDPHVPFSVPQGSAEALFGGPYKGPLGPSFEQSEEDALNDGKMKLDKEDARWLRALYDAEVLYHDKYLQEFIAGLGKRSLMDNTLFVILNDHGEEFGEEGRWGHSWTMGDTLFRSPLLLHFPGLFPAKTFDEVVEHIDVAPTIIDSLGVQPLPDAHGRSLLPLMRGQTSPKRYPYSALLFGRPKRRALRLGDYKLRVRARGDVELFDRLRDPAEKKNLAATHNIALRLCETSMAEAIANPRRSERTSDMSTPISIRRESIE